MALALTTHFSAPTGWIQPNASLAPFVWENPKQKDMHLSYLTYQDKHAFKRKSTADLPAYIAGLADTKSKMNSFLGLTAWKIAKYELSDYGKGQLIKMSGTYQDNNKEMQFVEWAYFLPGEQQEIELTFDAATVVSPNEAVALLAALTVEK